MNNVQITVTLITVTHFSMRVCNLRVDPLFGWSGHPEVQHKAAVSQDESLLVVHLKGLVENSCVRVLICQEDSVTSLDLPGKGR